MTNTDITKAILNVKQLIRQRWDHLGHVDADGGAFATGHIPYKAPQAYLCRCYSGLTDSGVDAAETESERYLPEPYRDLLKQSNGARIMGISLHGSTGGQNLRSTGDTIGQPISIRYDNAFYMRPAYIPEGHFGFGAINGKWHSQGILYLSSIGEVEMYNKNHDMIGARWPSLADFLVNEVTRKLTLYDDDGVVLEDAKMLPQDTEQWEALGAEESKQRKMDGSLVRRTLKKIRGKG